MSRNVTLLHIRGVDANKPALSDGELYLCTDSKRVFHGSVPNKLSVVVNEVDLTVQAAAIAATTLLTPAVTGMYKLNAYLKVTRAATTSSQLGSVTITYSDGTDSVAQTLIVLGQTQAGTSSIVNTGNSTTSVLTATARIWAVAGTPIKYAIGYTSTGATTMQYEAHLKVQLL